MFKKQISLESMGMAEERRGEVPETLPGIAEDKESDIGQGLSSSASHGQDVKLRLAKKKISDANRMSYDVASEMEKLRLRLQETTKQELAEFDRKFSPKLLHSGLTVSGEDISGSHSRQGSLDSSLPQKAKQLGPSVSPPTGPFPGVAGGVGGHGHARQHSLPIDPKYLRHLQQQNESSSPPNLTPLIGNSGRNGRSPLLSKNGSQLERNRSPTPPLMYSQVRQISGGSMSSTEGGTLSPPLTPNAQFLNLMNPQESGGHQVSLSTTINPPSYHRVPSGGVPSQYFKQGKAPGMARMPSDGAAGYARHTHQSSTGSSTSLTRGSPEGEGQVNGTMGNRSRSSSAAQPHYSTAVLKRSSKRGSQDFSTPSPSSGTTPTHQSGGGATNRYEEKPNGRPNAYEQPKRRSYGEDALEADAKSNRYPQHIPPRLMDGAIPASPKLTRLSDMPPRPGSAPKSSSSSSAAQNRRVAGNQEEIQPYMTSSHVKAQIQKLNFKYTPFSHQQPPQPQLLPSRPTAADGPKFGKQQTAKSGENTWI